MSDAIGAKPIEGDKTRTYGARFINYHPYYYRGIAYANLGQDDEARTDLERAQKPGALDLGSIESWLAKLRKPDTSSPPPPTMSQTPKPVASAPLPVPHPPKYVPPTPAAPTVTTATTPTTATTSAVPPSTAYPVDDELKEIGSIAFNTPPTAVAGEQKVIELLLDPRKTPSEIAKQIRENGRTETAVIKISKSAEASLTGTAFDIRAITPELQPISGTDTTEWRWEITPKETGKHRLFLAINAVIGSGPGEQRRSIRTYDREIDVQVSPRAVAARWAILAIALIAVIGGAIFLMRRGARLPADQGGPASATVKLPPPRGSWFEPGQIVANRYQIDRLLGKGGMGAVYAAQDQEFDGETIAIKTLLGSGTDERALARLRREIQVARRVGHPNVCRVFDVGYDGTTAEDRTIFVTMEYIAGRTLRQLIQERGRMSERDALPIVRGLAAGLDATHRAGLIHRDVKSANVMIADADGRAILMDFGLARANDQSASLTQTGAIVGSPMYMAPEQLQDAELTPATDIYAFGMVMFEMVTGRLPFEADTPMSLMARRLREDPVAPSKLAPDIDPLWDRTILRCLHRDPKQRFQNAGDVARALDVSDTIVV